MAKLPVYQPDRSVGTGSEFMRPDPAAGDTARGLVDLGHALTNLGAVNQRVEKERQNKAEADDNMRLQGDALDLRSTLRDEALRRQEQFPENSQAENFTRDLTRFADEEVERRIRERFPNRTDMDRVRLAYGRVVAPILDSAAGFEAQRRQQWRAHVSERRLTDLTSSLALSATPERFNQLLGEWGEFVTSSVGGSDAVRDRFLQMGRQRLQKAMLDAHAASNPEDFVRRVIEAQQAPAASPAGPDATDPSMDPGRRQSRTSLPSPNPLIREIVLQADTHGVPRDVMMGIGWIESRLNANAGRPRRSDGTEMSSAEGGFQIIDQMARAMGVRDKRDPAESTAAVAQFLSGVRARLQDRGIEPTPGVTYMHWNMGEGLARAVMRANSDERIEHVIHRVYAGNPEFADRVLANNPSLYRRGMTVQQVRDRYDAAMRDAMSATSGQLPVETPTMIGAPGASTQDARRLMSSIIGLDASELGAADLAAVLVQAQQAIAQTNRRTAQLRAGEAHIQGATRPDPYSETDRAAVGAAVMARGTATNIAAGDVNRHLEAARITHSVGFIPAPVMHAYREAMNSNGIQGNDGKIATYRALANISRDTPGIIAASQLPEADQNRIREFRMLTESLGLSELEAIRRIEWRRSPEGRQAHEAMRNQFNGPRRTNELNALTWNDIASHFNREWFSTPQAANDATRSLAVEAYRDSYQYWRERGYGQDEARGLALKDLKDSGRWGISRVMGSQTLMMYPPEGVLGEGRKIDGSFDWVERQIRAQLAAYLRSRPDIVQEANRGRSDRPVGNYFLERSQGVLTPERFAEHADFRLIPTRETDADVTGGQRDSPRYMMWFRRADGTMHDAGLIVLDYQGARRLAEFHATYPRQEPRWGDDYLFGFLPIASPIPRVIPEQRSASEPVYRFGVPNP